MILTASEWEIFIEQYPEAHMLQTRAWGELKSPFGWQPHFIQAGDAGAMVLFRKIPPIFTLAYIPKGPVGGNWRELWPDLDMLCRRKRAIFLKVEPDAGDECTEELNGQLPGFISGEPVQPHRTFLVDLTGDENSWLSRMKQKTRYNIRLAQKKGVVVRQSEDVSLFHQLMLATGERDQFGIHNLKYYQRAMDIFYPRGECNLLIAVHENRSLAGLMVFARGGRSWYFYGASTDDDRNLMPTYLLQWEAMRWAAARGCNEYDLWGIPDAEEETLEAGFTSRSDGLWGVYRFKRGFGGSIKRSAGAWDRVFNPLMYRLYRLWLARGD